MPAGSSAGAKCIGRLRDDFARLDTHRTAAVLPEGVGGAGSGVLVPNAVPDIVTIAKGAGGGAMPLGGAAISGHVWEQISRVHPARPAGRTFTNAPLACPTAGWGSGWGSRRTPPAAASTAPGATGGGLASRIEQAGLGERVHADDPPRVRRVAAWSPAAFLDHGGRDIDRIDLVDQCRQRPGERAFARACTGPPPAGTTPDRSGALHGRQANTVR